MNDHKHIRNQQTRETPLEGIASICSIVAIGLFALTFLFQNFMIPSSSMASTLLVGDHVMAERETSASDARWSPILPSREIKRGDVIVFYKPVAESNGQHIFMVKRVIGIPGDRLHLRNGVVYLNGVAQDEPHAARPTFASYNVFVDDFPLIQPSVQLGATAEWAESFSSFLQNGDLVIPSNRYFVMGDNRDNSLDSRYWGFVPRENIVGRPLFVYWSIVMPESGADEAPLSERTASTLHELKHFFSETRWSRTFHVIQ